MQLAQTFVRPGCFLQSLLRPVLALLRRKHDSEDFAGQGSPSVGFKIKARAEHWAQFLDGGELSQVCEPKMEQKAPRSPVKDRIAASFGASGGGDQLPAQQGVEGVAVLNAADGLHFGGRSRLFIGDDGGGFQRGLGQGRRRRQRRGDLF